ncbi:FUSC family membrane protein [Flaviaesturariibacter terrae]
MTPIPLRIERQEVRYFLYSQAFADGLRTTVAILVPALAGFYSGHFELGMTLSLGALCLSLTDAPGPVTNKRNGMLVAAIALFVTALLTSFARLHPALMAVELVLVTFFFSMFNAYGSRAAGVGNAAILIMILTMDKAVPLQQAAAHAALIMAGGLWYFTLSLAFSLISPYRPAQRVLGDCLRETARYLHSKASFYNPATDLQENYKNMVARQVLVQEKQEAVREILFKTRQIVQETTAPGRRLVLLFVEGVDLFEEMTHIYYDYDSLRKRFAATGALEKIARQVQLLARELDAIGAAVQMNRPYRGGPELEESLAALKSELDALPRLPTESHLVLRKILVNLRRLLQRMRELERYLGGDDGERRSRIDHGRFVTHQPLDPRIFADNLTLKSGVFRHSLRVAAACLGGYGMILLIAYGQHSYWVLLTIAFILKPAFSLTRERNIQRIIGTVAGGLIGITVLLLVPVRKIQFAIMVLCMLLTYSFMRINYLVMVLFTTPFVILLFSFLGMPFREVVLERLFDTVLGCAIAFGCSVLLFPSWEARQFTGYLQGLLDADRRYLALLQDALEGKPVPPLPYKLARKEIYVQTANLSAAFQRMLNEPRTLQRSTQQLQQFIVFQHILFSNIASALAELRHKEPQLQAAALRHGIARAQRSLRDAQQHLGLPPEQPAEPVPAEPVAGGTPIEEQALLAGQVTFIAQLCADMARVLAESYPSSQSKASS